MCFLTSCLMCNKTQKLTGMFYSDVPSAKPVAITKGIIFNNFFFFAWDASRNCIFCFVVAFS